jgi:hypothetical protein
MLLVLIFGLLPTLHCIFRSRLLSNETVLLELNTQINAKENTELHTMLKNPAIPFRSFKASITRGRWNYSKYGFLQVNPFGALLDASFKNRSSRSWRFLCSALDDCLSSSFRIVEKANCLLFAESNSMLTQIPEERISIDVFYALLRTMNFSSEKDVNTLQLLMEKPEFFEANYISIEVKYSSFEGMFLILTSLHQGEFAKKWKDSEIVTLEQLNVNCSHFLNPITWMHGEYALNIEKNTISPQNSISISGLLPGKMHINWNKSKLFLENEHYPIFQHCKFSPRKEAVQYACIVPNGSRKFSLSLDYTVKMSHFSQYPFDANRGIDISTPVVELSDGKRIILQTLLLSLHQPDFSMPYNVMIICFSVTMIFFVSLRKVLCKDPFAEHPLLKRLRSLRQLIKRPS